MTTDLLRRVATPPFRAVELVAATILAALGLVAYMVVRPMIYLGALLGCGFRFLPAPFRVTAEFDRFDLDLGYRRVADAGGDEATR